MQKKRVKKLQNGHKRLEKTASFFEFLRRAGLNRLRAGYAKIPKLLNRWCCSVACSITTRIGHNRLRFGPGFS